MKRTEAQIRASKKWYQSHGEEYNKNHREPHNVASINSRKNLRLEVINHYGGKCVCCGETTFEFLEFDHINNDGAEHRKKIGKSTMIAGWLKKNSYPKDFQLLCANCNRAKGFYGQCPHQIIKSPGT